MSLSHHLFRGGVLGGSVVDHLASQGSLAYEREKGQLIAVNAGSNTIPVLAVNGGRLLRRQVLPTLGSFPSPWRCTATSSTCSTPATAARSRATAASARCWRRSRRGTARWVSTPNATPEFRTMPGQVAVTPEGGKLLVTTKGNTGAIEVFDVNALGGASLHPVVASLPGAVGFAATVDSVGNLAVTEAGASAVAIFRNDDSTLTQVSSIAAGEAATCWIVRVGDTLSASNAGSGTPSEVRDAPGEPLALLGTVATDSGTVDAPASSDGTPTRVGSVTVPGAVGREGIVAG